MHLNLQGKHKSVPDRGVNLLIHLPESESSIWIFNSESSIFQMNPFRNKMEGQCFQMRDRGFFLQWTLSRAQRELPLDPACPKQSGCPVPAVRARRGSKGEAERDGRGQGGAGQRATGRTTCSWDSSVSLSWWMSWERGNRWALKQHVELLRE